MAGVALSIFITCVIVASKLITSGINYKVLQDVGLFFIFMMTLCLSSGTAFFLFNYCKEIVTSFSTYRFYSTLIGRSSLSLLIDSYNNVNTSFNMPIKAKHTDGNGNLVQGQWNGIGDWEVNGRKTTRKFSRNEKWE